MDEPLKKVPKYLLRAQTAVQEWADDYLIMIRKDRKCYYLSSSDISSYGMVSYFQRKVEINWDKEIDPDDTWGDDDPYLD